MCGSQAWVQEVKPTWDDGDERLIGEVLLRRREVHIAPPIIWGGKGPCSYSGCVEGILNDAHYGTGQGGRGVQGGKLGLCVFIFSPSLSGPSRSSWLLAAGRADERSRDVNRACPGGRGRGREGVGGHH